MKQDISIWLIPAKEDKIFLSKIIKQLAKDYSAYPFVPHLTIYAGVKTEVERIKWALNENIRDIKPFYVKVKKISHSDIFTKTLFLEIKENKSLLKIYNSLKKNLSRYGDYILKPHISLIYKRQMPVEEKTKVIKNLKIKDKILVDKCAIITAPKPITIESDVLKWKNVYQKKF